ncbi:MAG TPA: P-II family nitrogen regulator [Spirochaetia bacterium]|nr:MAG: transcriptional regulator [Spirochaetes bacterium GWB1_36_13]HCL55446.1 P-II family nitrogen regulator [Spirochaetia bacterium]
MKMIVAVVQPNKISEIKDALNAAGIERLTVLDVEGYGKQKGHTEIFRGREYEVLFTRKTQIEVVVKNEQEKQAALDAIIKTARTGNIGDGKIFILPVEEVIRIRTGEKNEEAI